MTSNNMCRILLAIKTKLCRDAWRYRLATEHDVSIVGEIDDDLDLLVAVRATEAQLIIHTWEGEEAPAIYSHLFAEFPGIKILGLAASGNRAVLCEQRLYETPLLTSTLEQMLESLRSELRVPLRASA
jgi:DNA-binding NarL/FixJ family response regulator